MAPGLPFSLLLGQSPSDGTRQRAAGEGDDVAVVDLFEPGQLQEDQMRVVMEGLEAGERFITQGLQRARPGMPVSVKSN